jgi:hypothetical protein
MKIRREELHARRDSTGDGGSNPRARQGCCKARSNVILCPKCKEHALDARKALEAIREAIVKLNVHLNDDDTGKSGGKRSVARQTPANTTSGEFVV